MERALRILLEGVIDYAGLFPPAKLTMEPAVEEFLAIREGPDAWLVTRFACPASRLPELAEELEKHEMAEPVPITVIGSNGKDKHHWDTALALDAKALAKFHEIAHLRGRIESYESRLPDNHHTEACLRSLEQLGADETFVEVPWAEGMEESVACIAESEFAFAKARTGGATPEAFPSGGELAAFIQQCVQLDIPFKLTAGLHQPLPYQEPSGARHHGFLNVLAAASLAAIHDLSKREIEKILSESSAKAFQFNSEKLVWGEFGVSLAEIADGRSLFRSFGSCSVAEPLEGLEKAGLLAVSV